MVVDKHSGEVLFDKKIFNVAEPQQAHKFNSYASPTPVADERRVYVTWGSPGTACLDSQTFKRLWQRRDLECNHFRGAGSSPVLFEDLLIMQYDGADLQYVVALDKRTGSEIWRQQRDGLALSAIIQIP